MAHTKNKVIIWRPFPSPTKRDRELPSVLSFSGMLKPEKQNSQRTNDEAFVQRWVELADTLNGKKKPNKKRSAA
ncbi:MAG: hypothetical protein DMG61_21960 [Acidobacteria bacterium]|nr:MAG: hypothetical protein DMG61_21960 [Acidobacteriota bacterium]